MAHFVRAARHAVAAKNWPALLIAAAENLWNCALPLAGAAVSRRLARAPVRAVLACADASGCAETPLVVVQTQLLGLLLECHADDREWTKGLSVIDGTLRDLNARKASAPKEAASTAETNDDDEDGAADDAKTAEKGLRALLLEWRVRFTSRLGRSSSAGLKVDGDAATHARVWATLARAASSPHQQLNAYQRALDAVAGRFERVEYRPRRPRLVKSRGDAATRIVL